MRNIRIVLYALPICFLCASCSSSSSTGRVATSSDGNWIAYLRGETAYIQSGPEPIPVHENISIFWARTNMPAQRKTMALDSCFLDGNHGNLRGQTHICFSPKGNSMAIVLRKGIRIVDLASGKTQNIPFQRNEVASSFSWLDESTIAYVTNIDISDSNCRERFFWRQRCQPNVAKRELLHHDSNVEGVIGEFDQWPKEFWSPDGRSVVFSDATNQSVLLGRFPSSEIRSLGSGKLSQASWDNQSSNVLFTTRTRARTGKIEGYDLFLYDVGRSKQTDLSTHSRKIFQDEKPFLERTWTPDDQSVVVSCYPSKAFLICPQPWECKPLFRKKESGGRKVIIYDRAVLKLLGENIFPAWTVIPGHNVAVAVTTDNKLKVIPLDEISSDKMLCRPSDE